MAPSTATPRIRPNLDLSSTPVKLGLLAAAVLGTAGGVIAAAPASRMRTLLALVAASALILAAGRFLWRRPQAALLAIVLLLPFQQVAFAWLFHSGVAQIASILGLGKNGALVNRTIVGLARFWKETLLLLIILKALTKWKNAWDQVDQLVFLFVGLAALYALLPIGPDFYVRLAGFREIAAFLLLFLAIRHMPLPKQTMARLEMAVLVVGCVLTLFAFWNSFAPDSFARWFMSIGIDNYRRIVQGSTITSVPVAIGRTAAGGKFVRAGSLLTPLTFPYYLLIPIGICLGRFVTNRARWWHILTALLCLAGLILTLTRSAIAAAPLMVILAMLTGWKRGQLAMGLAAALIVLWPLASTLSLSSRESSALNPSDPSRAAHILALKLDEQRLVDEPFGTGLGSAGGVSQRFELAKGIINESWYFQIGTELGVAGLAFYVLLVLAALRSLWRRARLSRGADPRAVGTLCALAGIAAGGLVLHNLEDFAVSWTLWALIAFALRSETEPTHDSARQEVPVLSGV